jgi:hypothetical protein
MSHSVQNGILFHSLYIPTGSNVIGDNMLQSKPISNYQNYMIRVGHGKTKKNTFDFNIR